MIIVNNLSPEVVSIGAFSLRYYSLMFLIAFSFGYWYVKREAKNRKLPLEPLDTLLNYIIVLTILGARLYHCFVYEPEYYLSNFSEVLKVWHGGLASHGGIMGLILAIIIFLRKHKEYKLNFFLDYIAVVSAFGGALIRIGNYFNSEIIGKVTGSDYGVIFSKVDNLARHPAQLYESVLYFIIFIITHFLLKYKKLKEGQTFALSLFLVMSGRIFLEAFKENQVVAENNMLLNLGQLSSIPFIIFAIYYFIKKR